MPPPGHERDRRDDQHRADQHGHGAHRRAAPSPTPARGPVQALLAPRAERRQAEQRREHQVRDAGGERVGEGEDQLR
jgi:hypothetical protein